MIEISQLCDPSERHAKSCSGTNNSSTESIPIPQCPTTWYISLHRSAALHVAALLVAINWLIPPLE